MMEDRAVLLRTRAFELWEQAGCPVQPDEAERPQLGGAVGD